MSVPEMGLSKDGARVWYRYKGRFWTLSPGYPKGRWEVTIEDSGVIGFGETILDAIDDALEKE